MAELETACREMGAGTDTERASRQLFGAVKRFDKRKEAAEYPVSLGWLKATFTDAIEYTGMTRELRGIVFFGGVFYGLVAAPIFVAMGISFASGGSSDIVGTALGIITILASLFSACYVTGTAMRLTLWQPSDLPVIFDRRKRKIYRLLREERPGITGLFQRWPVRACTYDWDLVDAQHAAEWIATGANVTRNHSLVFVVRKSAKDSTIIDTFQIANAMVLSEQLVPCMWEHIRRFMMERGPHLPAAAETPVGHDAPRSWWQSVGDVGVFGPNYLRFWREQPAFTLLCHVLFPLFLPINLIWGTGNWLSYKTEIQVDWPDEVKQAIGKPL